MDTPILLNAFNRPDVTRSALADLRQVQPSQLYLAADGPRSHVPADLERCAEVRRILTAIDWNCNVRTLFREQNLGCQRAIGEAIGWFFDHEPCGIILEDDVRVSPTFYPFCTELLSRFADNDCIGIISGCNFAGHRVAIPDSYCFIRNLHMWGWATWRRVWQQVDLEMEGWHSLRQANFMETEYDASWATRVHWEKTFDNVAKLPPTTWDFQVCYSLWQRGLLSVMPGVNQIGNAGFGKMSTHTKGGIPRYLAANPPRPLNFPLRHPDQITVNHSVDRWLDRDVYGISFLRSMRRMLQMKGRAVQHRLFGSS